MGLKFDPAKIARLDDPGRFDDLDPDVLWEALGVPGARVIVDIGAGTGMFAEAFATLAPGAVVYAADTDQRMLDWVSEKRASLVDSGRIVPVLSTETSVPLPDGTADIAIMINLHHELDSAIDSYADAARLLREGGRLLVADWADRPTPKGPPLEARSSASEIAGLLIEAGFDAVAFSDALPYHSLLVATK